MKILVTGGAGFIGHHLVRNLLDQSHEVAVVDNFTNYGIIPEDEMKALHDIRLARIPESVVYRTDIIDFKSLHNAFSEFKPDIVVHCAAYPRAKVIDANPSEGIAVLTTGLTNILNCCKEFDIQRFVYVSSSMVYGDVKYVAHEDHKCKPNGIYSVLKYAGEITSKDFCKANNIECRIVRPSSVYGPYDINDRVVSKFMSAAINGEKLVVHGSKERLDFTYIDDVVDGLSRITTSESMSNRQIYNISYGVGRTIKEAAELIVKIVGKGSIKLSHKDLRYPSRSSFSIIGAMQDFGYQPKTDMETGFTKYYEWIINERIL